MTPSKTVITLTAVNDLKYNRFEVSKVLVIAPKKVAESTWLKEQSKWAHLKNLRVVSVLGSQAQRLKALNSSADVYVINRENVVWLVEHYRNAWSFDMVVADEFSSFKSRSANRFKALRQIRPHIKRFVGLTGTPAPNGLLDLWAQIFLLDQGARLGKTLTGYRDKYFEPNARSRTQIFSYKPREGAENAVKRLISDICISLKAEDYLELPGVLTRNIAVKLSDRAQQAYNRMEREMLLSVGDNDINVGSAAALTNKLLQLCNGAVYDAEHRVHPVHDCKMQTFTELVEGLNGQPALVFYSFRHDLERIKANLKGTGLRVRELATQADQEAWNNREVDILLAHPASAAYGLNLQDGGNHVIWFGLNWSLELYQQANARLHRQGQTQKVIIHRLIVEGGVDEDVAAALELKGDTQEALLQALRARIDKCKGAVC